MNVKIKYGELSVHEEDGKWVARVEDERGFSEGIGETRYAAMDNLIRAISSDASLLERARWQAFCAGVESAAGSLSTPHLKKRYHEWIDKEDK